jgi:hypothetical protein
LSLLSPFFPLAAGVGLAKIDATGLDSLAFGFAFDDEAAALDEEALDEDASAFTAGLDSAALTGGFDGGENNDASLGDVFAFLGEGAESPKSACCCERIRGTHSSPRVFVSSALCFAATGAASSSSSSGSMTRFFFLPAEVASFAGDSSSICQL